MLDIVPNGENRYRIVDAAGEEIGWIHGRAVRFFGFTSQHQVVDAARRAWRALERVLNRELTRASVITRLAPLRLVHDGAYEWISDGRVPIARMVRSPQDERFAIELVVPSRAPESLVLSAARAIGDSLRAPPDDAA